MEAADLQRYKNRRLERQREMLFERADAEAELERRLHQSEGRLLRAIDDALARMRKGTTAFCEVCKEPISKARLEAVPWARLCRACKEARPPPA